MWRGGSSCCFLQNSISWFEHLQKMKERAAKLAPELSGMNKLLAGAGKELRSPLTKMRRRERWHQKRRFRRQSTAMRESSSNLPD